MFGTLIESRPLRQRRRGSAALSAIIHTAIVAGAVAATVPEAHAPPPPPPPRDTIIWTHSGDAQPPRPAGPSRPCDFCTAPPLPPIDFHPRDVVPIPPVEDAGPRVAWDSLLAASPTTGARASGSLVDNPYARGSGSGSPTGVFDRDQVERAVAVLGTVRPAYPEMLRAAGVEGRVVVRFVVDTAGRVEPGSITTVEATHLLFERSVRDVLARMRFAPAEVGGRHVRQLVEMPFQFSLSNR